jgi:hypothetical protein
MARQDNATSFASHQMRLSVRHWLAVAVIIALLFALIPRLWQRVERFEPDTDYRIPYELSSDYWLYDRYCRRAGDTHQVLIVGDSVIWGHYVPPDESLSHYLNEITGKQLFANMGIDGVHPVALAGLVKYYGNALSDTKIVLCFNPLWITSKKHDLQDDKEFSFNHQRLAPQFVPKIACYSNPTANRIGIVIERNSDFLSWVSHLQIAYFDNMDLSSWALEHPRRNPLSAVTGQLPAPATSNDQRPTWNPDSTARQDFPWVDLEASLQWEFFKRSISTLAKRRNNVFVLITPFNEHMMTRPSLEAYNLIKNQMADWLAEEKIEFLIPPPLPGEHYADASHPLASGYALLAQQLCRHEPFRTTILDSTANPK